MDDHRDYESTSTYIDCSPVAYERDPVEHAVGSGATIGNATTSPNTAMSR